jgi:hypothetical protein
MSTIVSRVAGTPVSDEAKQQLEKLAAMPDSEIDTSDIPEWTEEQFATASARRDIRWQEEGRLLRKKAS